jgi:two-component system, NarL family, response regulator NreC
MTVRLVLADDHPIVRKGLKALLEAETEMRVAGEASDGLEAINLVEKIKPDVLLLDIMMPGLNGLDVARHVSQHFPLTRIIVLSMHSNEAYVLDALRNGASGYVLKDASIEELVEAIRQVMAGHRYLCPPLSERAIEEYVKRSKTSELDPYKSLTEREREVLHLAAEGNSNAEIAGRLSISIRTVETHRMNLLHKLSLRTQTDLVRFAIQKGLID